MTVRPLPLWLPACPSASESASDESIDMDARLLPVLPPLRTLRLGLRWETMVVRRSRTSGGAPRVLMERGCRRGAGIAARLLLLFKRSGVAVTSVAGPPEPLREDEDEPRIVSFRVVVVGLVTTKSISSGPCSSCPFHDRPLYPQFPSSLVALALGGVAER